MAELRKFMATRRTPMPNSYLVYQLRPEVYEVMQTDRDSDVAQIAFDLLLLNDKTVGSTVLDAVYADMYYPTKFIHMGVLSDHFSPMEEVFAAGNGYSNRARVVSINGGGTSLSVGNIVVNLQEDKAYVCMPVGWHELDIKLQLK
jgi:hypothetical protein